MGLPGLDGTRRKTGLTVLHQLLLEVLAPLPGVADVALCGNGLVPPGSPHGPYLYRLEPGTRRASGTVGSSRGPTGTASTAVPGTDATAGDDLACTPGSVSPAAQVPGAAGSAGEAEGCSATMAGSSAIAEAPTGAWATGVVRSTTGRGGSAQGRPHLRAPAAPRVTAPGRARR